MGDRVAILHIGQPKTGSTSIQHSLAGYDDGSTFYATFELIHHSRPICTGFSSDPMKYWYWELNNFTADEVRMWKEKYLAEFSEMLKRRDRSRIIISAENVWNLESEDKKKLVEFIRQHGWEVHVIAYVREPTSWAASYLPHLIKGRVITEIPQKLDPKYRLGLEAFAGILPPEHLQVRVFDRKHLACGDVVADFRQALGLDHSKAESHRHRVAISLSTIKLLFLFYRLELLAPNDAENLHAHRQCINMIKENAAGTNRLETVLCEGIAEYSETNWLYETFGIDFRRMTPPDRTKADLEAVLVDLSDVDLSGLDEMLAEYEIAGEKFATAEQKLYRLFDTILVEHSARLLYNKLGRNLQKNIYYRVLKHLSKYLIHSEVQRKALVRTAVRIRKLWINRGRLLRTRHSA